MTHRYIILLICIISVSANYNISSAQTDHTANSTILTLSPADSEAERFRFDIEANIANIIRLQPAMYDLENLSGVLIHRPKRIQLDSTLSDSLYRTTHIRIRHSDGNIEGDYVPRYGNSFRDTEVNADAVYGTAGSGTIYGSMSFSKGKHGGYAWNAIRHSDLYTPYLIADSTGGDYEYENYYVSGGYSSRLSPSLYYGVGGAIRGEVASRQTDPRCANTTTWLNVDASVALRIDTVRNIAVRISYLRNQQYLSLFNWRPNQQDRFFVTYGLGYYDLQASPVSFGIRRMYYINGLQTQITYSNLYGNDYKSGIIADIKYSFLSMTSEESSAKRLFGSDTHHADGEVWIKSRPNSRLSLIYGIQTENRIRFGRENIYEIYRPDERYPSIYDFRLIDVRKRYSEIISASMLQGKLSYAIIGDKLSVEALLGIGYDYKTETYDTPPEDWAVLTLLPSVGVGLRGEGERFEWRASCRLVDKMPINYRYNIRFGEDFRLDYQETFLQYAYYADRSISLYDELYCSFRLERFVRSIGLSLKHHWRSGQRPDDIKYLGTPRIVSPLLSTPSHNRILNSEHWLSLSLIVSL